MHIYINTTYKDRCISFGKTYKSMCKYTYIAEIAFVKRNMLTLNILKQYSCPPEIKAKPQSLLRELKEVRRPLVFYLD